MSFFAQANAALKRLLIAGWLLVFLSGWLTVNAADFEEVTYQDMVFISIPAGTFTMGAADELKAQLKAKEAWTRFDECERPPHKVTLSKPFLIGKYEVTQKQWTAVMGGKKKPSAFKGENLPVESVSWAEVQSFLTALNKKEGKDKYRLPTEAEWEYCCRAGGEGVYGQTKEGAAITPESLGDYAWYTANAGNKTHPVGTKKPNAWGLYDMHGNVWEWCQDWYGFGFYANAPANDPVNAETETERVIRGGSWFLGPNNLRCSFRGGSLPDAKSSYIGFRLVREP